jgi:glutaminase
VPASTNDNELDLLVGRMKAAAAPLRSVLREIHARYAGNDEGKVADYIPELAKADRRWFGITIATTDGQVFEVGDCRQLFTIQSVSKPFVFGLALEDHGVEHVLSKVGVEPTGEAFNAIILDEASNRPFNPMVNAGSIATADLVKGRDHPDRVSRMLAMFSRYCGRDVYIDNSVFMSERLTGHRNRAIGHLMLNFGMVGQCMEESLELYFQQCSVLVNCHDLAIMGATLANGGVNPVTGQRAIQQPYVKYLLSIMLSCGMYDYAGEWAYRVGIPAKSGVGGGIVGVIPGQFGIGIFSPPLDSKGNSVRGILAFRELSQQYGLHIFESGFTGTALRDLLAPVRGSET